MVRKSTKTVSFFGTRALKAATRCTLTHCEARPLALRVNQGGVGWCGGGGCRGAGENYDIVFFTVTAQLCAAEKLPIKSKRYIFSENGRLSSVTSPLPFVTIWQEKGGGGMGWDAEVVGVEWNGMEEHRKEKQS